MRLFRLATALCAALLLVLPNSARAEERILRFISDVRIERDGSLDVTETINVNVEGSRIQRGIFRDFPTRYRDRLGRQVRVGFEVKSVEREGAPSKYVLEALGNGTRVRIGDPDVNLPYGEHEYVIRYRTTRQLGYFDDFDELYWNATGNGWEFPIDVAEARITLPTPAPFGARSFYTGVQDSTAKDAAIVSEEPGRIVFRTTRPLAAYEGLTVAVAWPKGIVAAPDSSTRLGWWLADEGPIWLALFGLIGLLVYYFYAWRRVGRGPRAGTIVPLFTPPDDMSPAAVRHIAEMGFDSRAFSAAIVDLGVRGRIRLVEGEKRFLSRPKMTIEKIGGETGLPGPEAAMMTKLFSGGDSILMDDKNHATFSAAQTALGDGLKKAHEGPYFVRNLTWSMFGLLLIGIAILLPASFLVLTDSPTKTGSIAVLAGLLALGLAMASFRMRSESAAMRWTARIIGVLFGLVASSAAFVTIGIAFESGRILPLLLPLLALPAAISAFWWMAAPTRQGRALMDRIAGFRRYLSITEEERLDTLHPPEKTPALFERYLPYAIALEVENEWASRFTAVLAAAAAAGQAQSLGWYSGHSDPWRDPDGFANQMGSSLASTIASASTAPGSSSGSGGGSSGGGGGGGGGGGW